MNKIKIKIIFFPIFLSLLIFSVNSASGEEDFLREAHIQYKQVGWQTYDFAAETNLGENADLKYQWDVDGKTSFSSARLHYFFEKGEHQIRLRAEDKYGNIETDSVRLEIQFWSLRNNWFWWIVYFVIISIVGYYWIVKILYLLNRRRVSRDVRRFMDVLDEHGWVEKFIERNFSAKAK